MIKGITDGPTNRRRDTRFYRIASSRPKIHFLAFSTETLAPGPRTDQGAHSHTQRCEYVSNNTERSTMRPQATFLFFIFFSSFFAFLASSSPHPPRPSFLPVPPSFSSSFLPPRPSFLLVPPSSSTLFFHHPALSKSFKICKSQFFIDFDESIINQPTDQPTNQPTDGQGLL